MSDAGIVIITIIWDTHSIKVISLFQSWACTTVEKRRSDESFILTTCFAVESTWFLKWIYEKNISARWMDNYNKMLKTTTIWRLRISINVDTTLLRDTVGVIELRVWLATLQVHSKDLWTLCKTTAVFISLRRTCARSFVFQCWKPVVHFNKCTIVFPLFGRLIMNLVVKSASWA